ncbi:hypothetical protein HZB96_02995 [Candidatus Gottesmanbacteria bacterium]|nr:hypothetical protein [Candidatus Gottesmanbacteria bacterium]MBI5452353.1 hypothetical protein [Candidatus Gottesmanbacteria bacterium]
MRKNDKTYKLMVSKMHEVAAVPTQNLGPFTFIYKKLIPYFKFSPWRSAAIISFAATVFLYLLLGSTLVRLASALQFGF